MKHVALLMVLGLSTGCAGFNAFYAKSSYVGDKTPVYNSDTGQVQYVYNPNYVAPGSSPYYAPAPARRP
jgi:hypothetical protein